ncbi:MAG: leucine--tRNA ligase, partial [Phycisphaerae bacterium]
NIANIERQIKMFGFSYDWFRRVATTDPDYYRWTQWIFLQIYNSWFDPDLQQARPISELVDKLEAGDLVIDLDGNLIPTPPMEEIEAVSGGSPGLLKFQELDHGQQLRLINEYRLAYQAEVPVNWCPKLGTVLANEEVTNEGRSERGNHPVYRRALKQWMLRITAYAERLLADIETVDWPEPIKIMQRNWIGKSIGADVDFPIPAAIEGDADDWFDERKEGGWPGRPEEGVIRVYTTRPDTLYGATYMVLAPEHPLVGEITTPEQSKAVSEYVQQAVHKSELERTAETKEKTGVFTGAYAINPVTREPIPVWVADYVMMGYGTGAIMAVPAHDTRDFEFAQAFDLPIVQVVQPPSDSDEDWRGYTGEGTAVHSGDYDGLATDEFKPKITSDLHKRGLARRAVNYKLRDWLFSRQRYWGEPFPIVHCESCGTVGLPDEQLPLLLPEMEDFTPAASDDRDAPPAPPLGKAVDWMQTTCPRCGDPARRELNTMPQWAGSCWYYLRYLDPDNSERFVSPQAEQYWMAPSEKNPTGGVDLYVGGAEHAVLHLLYARFWHKVLYDLGHVSTPEPFGKLFNQGMITSFTYRDSRGVSIEHGLVDLTGEKPRHNETGEELTTTIEKMSKSLKNVVNPDDIIEEFGADTFRLYEMFMGPLESSKPWNTRDVPGVHRFLHRTWRMIAGSEEQEPLLGDRGSDEIEKALHKLIRKVGEDYETMKFNTAIAAMMEFVNSVYKAGTIDRSQARRFVLLLAPLAPHICEELWSELGSEASLAYESWPTYDEAMIAEDTVELPVQINGKVRSRVQVAADASKDDVLEAAMADARVKELTDGKEFVKKIVVPGRLVNLVVKR